MQSLKARPDVSFSERDGWIVAVDQTNMAVWLFDHPGDATYPTVIKRAPKQSGKDWVIGSTILCGGSKAVCDALAVHFAK